eukprot:836352-Pleurochrysis_carterae.AAC.2
MHFKGVYMLRSSAQAFCRLPARTHYTLKLLCTLLPSGDLPTHLSSHAMPLPSLWPPLLLARARARLCAQHPVLVTWFTIHVS